MGTYGHCCIDVGTTRYKNFDKFHLSFLTSNVEWCYAILIPDEEFNQKCNIKMKRTVIAALMLAPLDIINSTISKCPF